MFPHLHDLEAAIAQDRASILFRLSCLQEILYSACQCLAGW
jgi:hypothetical protein